MAGPDWLTSTQVAIVAGKGDGIVDGRRCLHARRGTHRCRRVFHLGRRPPRHGTVARPRELDHNDRILRKLKGAGQVRGRTIPADQAFGDYLELKGVGGVLRRAASAASLPMVAAGSPGLEHLLVLGKVEELARDRAADLIVVDTPPTACGTVPAFVHRPVRRGAVGTRP